MEQWLHYLFLNFYSDLAAMSFMAALRSRGVQIPGCGGSSPSELSKSILICVMIVWEYTNPWSEKIRLENCCSDGENIADFSAAKLQLAAVGSERLEYRRVWEIDQWEFVFNVLRRSMNLMSCSDLFSMHIVHPVIQLRRRYDLITYVWNICLISVLCCSLK